MNRLYFGDNLDILRRDILDNSVDLIYLDPPFNSNASYNLLYKTPVKDGPSGQLRAFKDTWSWEEDAAPLALDEIGQLDANLFRVLHALQASLGESDLMAYLVMMSIRLLEMRRVLKATGTIVLHCDPTASHYLKIILDGIFGGQWFKNEIVWLRNVGRSHSKRRLPSNHDILLMFGSPAGFWNEAQAFLPYDHNDLPAKTQAKYANVDPDGRRYQLDNLINPNPDRPNLTYEFLGVTRVWRWTKERMQDAYNAGQVVQTAPGRVPRLKRYLDEQRGMPLGDVWTDIRPLNSQADERIGYPTQKPLALLERIIGLTTRENAVVLDPFCGCGTTIHAAERLGRQWIGIDVSYAAILVIKERLASKLPSAQYEIDGIPSEEAEARALAKLDPYTFQQWAVGRVNGQPRGKGADRGIDGEIIYKTGSRSYDRAIISVKAGRNVGPAMLRDLGHVVEREGAQLGVFICLNEPTREMRLEAQRSPLVEIAGRKRHKLQIMTVRDLIERPDLGLKTELGFIQSAQEAKAIARRPRAKTPTPDQLRREPPLPPMSILGGKASANQVSMDLDEPLLVTPSSSRRKRARR
ncbi:site-specific DNA-methyltransferase [Sphingobium sp. ZW T5_29]|uniref:site-specific DNA-methyltransferase n=1 Tax=Sphingobium sp. ZW T5_29 TaxID=3378077 RepID=UPI0038522BA7